MRYHSRDQTATHNTTRRFTARLCGCVVGGGGGGGGGFRSCGIYGRMLHQDGGSTAGPWFNIKMPPYQYRKSHGGDKMIVRSSYLNNGISYTCKMAYLYWIRAQDSWNACRITRKQWDNITHRLETLWYSVDIRIAACWIHTRSSPMVA